MHSERQEDKPEQRVPLTAHGLAPETQNKKEVLREAKPGKKSNIGRKILSKLRSWHWTSNSEGKNVSTGHLDGTSTSTPPEKTKENKTDVANDAANQDATKIKKNKWWKFSSSKKVEVKPVFNDTEDGLETPEELSHKAGPETCTPKPPEKTRENGNKNPDALADIENEKTSRTEGKKWWKIFSSKTKKTKTISGDTRQQRDGQKKKKWWKIFSFKTKKTKTISGDTRQQRVGQKKKKWWKPTKFFKHRTTSPRIYLREETEAHRKLSQELKSSCNSQPYVIKVSMNGAPIQMMVNSYFRRSFIGQDVWEKIGKPNLELNEDIYYEVNAKRAYVEGSTRVLVEYSGIMFCIRLFVLKQSRYTNSLAVLGTCWFRALLLDLNSIFATIQYCKTGSGNQQAKKRKTFEILLQKYRFTKPVIPLPDPKERCQICEHIWDPVLIPKAKLDNKKPFYIDDDYLVDYPSLTLRINEILMALIIHSGIHHSCIPEDTWKDMGKPSLEPVQSGWVDLFGSKNIKLMGKFMANVEYDRRMFLLPLVVVSDSNRSKCSNFFYVGRCWLSSLNVDWNKVMNPVNVDFRYETTNMMKLALELKTSCNSQCFFIKVRMEGVDIKMIVDSGTYVTVIGRSVWKALGKPKLEKTKFVFSTPNGRSSAVKGKCFVNVEYSGQKCVLPLLVFRRRKYTDSLALIGGNWFHLLRIDFNSLFERIHYCNKKTSSQAKKQKGSHKYSKNICQICYSVWDPEV
ncbi:Uncharacterized protein APZ42_016639 [Daphnia magna]|uniref:Peptidase A2 domain-containing protein n=1 Tax=Daphnia magna TaxID=35525 RepID=A0A165ABH9_9CRUS|nr:Uncharacterized protein APZ42_016639 [Daphnia magna]